MLVSFHLETVLVSVQDRCMICAERTTGLESFWTLAMLLLGEEAQVEARFNPPRDSANLDAR
jgi:hypothetical protein